MRPFGSAKTLEERRCLAVTRVCEGYDPLEVAEFLGVDVSSVYRWLASYEHSGQAGLEAMAVPGRPPKLTPSQTQRVLGWLKREPQRFGFPTPRWTAPRLALVIARDLGVKLHPHYLNTWLRERGVSPQIPTCVARERDPKAIEHWTRYAWPGIKKGPRTGCHPCF